MNPGGLALLSLGILWTPAATQAVRDFTVERGRRAETSLRVIVDFGAGELTLRPSTDGALYRMRLRYDADRFEPRGAYDARRGTVRLGLARSGGGGRAGHRDRGQQATIEVTPDADLTLDATLGAGASTLELGGLRLEDLAVSTGTSRTEIRFSRPNPVLCRQAQVSSGAAELRVERLGNSGCRRWSIEGGMGQVALDLDGEWPELATVGIRMTVGGVRLAIPGDLGVRIRLSRVLASFTPEGFTRTGNTWTSANYDRAARTVDLEIETALGRVEVAWK